MIYRLIAIMLLLATATFAQQPNVLAVSNGASFAQNYVASGSISTIFGTNLATKEESAAALPLSTELDNLIVTVNGTLAPLFYVSTGQINFQIPRAIPAGNATLVVRRGTLSSQPFAFTLAPAAPGIFQFGANQAVATKPDGSLITAGNPAEPNSVIVVYLTGEGLVSGAVADGAASPLQPLAEATLARSATIGGLNAAVEFLGLTPGFAALLQANIRVPATLAGGSQPIVVTIGGAASKTPAPTINVSGPPAPLLTQLGTTATGGGNVNVVVRDSLAYVCGAGISVVNVGNPNQPQLVNNVSQGAGVCRALDNNLVRAEGGNPARVRVFSLSNPQSPNLVGGPLTSPHPFLTDVYLTPGRGLFSSVWFEFTTGPNRIFSQHGDLFSMDLSNPAQPTVLSSLTPLPNDPPSSNQSPYFGSLGIGNDTLLLLSTTNTADNTASGVGRIVVIDIGNASNLRAVRQITVSNANTLNCGAVSGTTGLVVGNTRSWTSPGDFAIRGNVTLTTLNLSDPRNPQPITTVVTGEQNTFTAPTCVPLGNGFFAYSSLPLPEVGGSNRIVFVDARNPANPSIAGSVQLAGLAEKGLAVSGNWLYAATGAALTVFQVNPQ